MKTEIIAFASAKAGTGKTSLMSSLGYALTRSGHQVLLMDADLATDGFSLFILGPKGITQVSEFLPENTFAGFLNNFVANGAVKASPRTIHRVGSDDHELSYQAIISGRGLYGALPQTSPAWDTLRLPATIPTDANVVNIRRESYRQAIVALFDTFRSSGEYDYVLVDTRGGFSFESTDIVSAADSFILVTEANYTCLYQDRGLVERTTVAAREMGTKPLFKAIIVNKATEGQELRFRAALTNEFGLRHEDTFAVALDFDAARVNQAQQIIYKQASVSQFAFDTLAAFADILKIATGQWPPQRVNAWNQIAEEVKAAITQKHEAQEKAETEAKQQLQGLLDLKTDKDRLEIALQQTRGNLEQARKGPNELIETLKAQLTQVQQALEKEKKSARQWAAEKQMETEQLAKIQQEKLDLTLSKVNSEKQSAILEQEVKTRRRIRRLKSIMFLFGLLAFFTATLWAISAWVIRQEVTERRVSDEQNTVLSQKVTELEADKQGLQARISELTAPPHPLAASSPSPSPSPLETPSPSPSPLATPSPLKTPSPRPSPLKTPSKSHHHKKRLPSNQQT